MPFINGIGPLELVVVLVIALIVIGPGRLPDVGSALGKSIREFRSAASEVKEASTLAPAPLPTEPPMRAEAVAGTGTEAPAAVSSSAAPEDRANGLRDTRPTEAASTGPAV